MAKKAESIENLSFEQAMEKLEEAVSLLKSGKLSLEESIQVYDKSIMYHKLCEKILSEAKQKIEIYRPESDTTEDFER